VKKREKKPASHNVQKYLFKTRNGIVNLLTYTCVIPLANCESLCTHVYVCSIHPRHCLWAARELASIYQQR